MGVAADQDHQNGICVFTPLRIRLGANALAQNSGELEKALHASLRRALANSRETVLKPRRDAHVVLNPPTFRWSDSALEQLPLDERCHLRSRIEKIWADLCISEGIFGWGRKRHPGPAQSVEVGQAVREPVDPARLDDEEDSYLTPSYDKGGEKRKIPVAKEAAAPELTVEIGSFADLGDVYRALHRFYKEDFRPKGSTLTGVYGYWQEDGTPRLFWVTAVIEEGPQKGDPLLTSMSLSGGKIENGNFVANPQQPMSVKPGERYTLVGLTAPKKSKDIEYWAERFNAAGGNPVPVYAHDRRIVGKTVRFGVVKEVTDPASIITVLATPAPPGKPVSPLPPTRQTAGYDAWYPMLNPVPEGGEPEWLWWWFVWFNVRPAEIRALPAMRKVFQDLQNAGARDKAIQINWLFEVQSWQVFIYRAYCRNLTLELLETSRKNMAEFRTAIRGGDFKTRLAAELAILKQPAEELVEVDELPSLEHELSVALYGEYSTRNRANLRVKVRSENPERAKALQPRVEHARSLLKNAEDYKTILKLFEQMDPILALFTVSGERTISIEAGITQALAKSPDDLVAWMDSSLDYLTKKAWEASNEIASDFKAAAKLRIVQQIANEQLEPWFKEVPGMRAAMEYVTETSIVDWLLLGFALLVLTIAFPPVGIALSAGVAVGSAIHSTLNAMQLSRLGQARLAQYGFTPLVSEAEIMAAWFEAAVDIFFAVLEIKGVGKGVAKFVEGAAERAAAREAVGVVGQRIEQILASWRKFDQWPIALQAQVRANVTEQLLKRGVTAAEDVEKALTAVQREMLYRYEQELLQFQRKFGKAIEGGAVSARDVEAMRKWLQTEFKRPEQFLNDLTGELQPGKSLFEETIGRQLKNLPPVDRVVVEFFEQLTEQQIVQFKSGLRNGGLLTPNRVSALAKEAGISTTYRDLASRLDSILARVENPDRALALVEDLLAGRKDAAAILSGLEASANPRRALEAMLSPKVLEASLDGGVGELFEAFAAPARSGGTVGRVVADVDERGAVKLFREIEGSRAVRGVERWEGRAKGWATDPRARIAAPAAAPRAIAEVSADAQAKAVADLENLAKAKRAAGGLTSGAVRAGETLSTVRGHAVFEEIAKVIAREGEETGRRVLDGLGYLVEDGVKGRELDGLADFLRRGGTGREAAAILEQGATSARVVRRAGVSRFFEKVLAFREADFAGVTFVLGSRGTRFEGAEAVRYIAQNFDRPEAVFGALADLRPHSDGLEKVVGYLQSFSQNRNRAAVAQLKAAQELLVEFPGHRLVFEEPAFASLAREIDVRVVTPVSRATVLDVELKEISTTFFIQGADTQRQFARDVVRSVHAAGPGERPLGRIRWIIREQEILAEYMQKNAITDIAKAREGVLNDIKQLFEKAFDHGDIGELTKGERAAARKDFEDHFSDIVKLF